MKIDAYASLPHYRAHIDPVWASLPESARGVFAGRCGDWRGRWERDRAVIVASWGDAKRVAPRRFVYVEHGSGQSYDGHVGVERVGGYSGAGGLEDCLLFLCPNETVAQRWRRIYPDTPAVTVGCPRLDVARARRSRPRDDRTPVAAFTFHWDCTVIPETRSAWAHYARRMDFVVRELRSSGVEAVGHGHPRDLRLLQRRWDRLGVPYWADAQRVLDEASVLVADNTSLLWEAAAVNMPLVLLDAPWYRRDIEHGLRFWAHADAGPRVCDADAIPAAVRLALRDPASFRANRRAAAAAVYSGLDGGAAERAAAAVMSVTTGAIADR